MQRNVFRRSTLFLPVTCLVLLALAESRATPAFPEEAWGECREDKDCVLLLGVCQEELAAARKAKADVQSWVHQLAPRFACSRSNTVAGKSYEPAEARCVESQCKAVVTRRMPRR